MNRTRVIEILTRFTETKREQSFLNQSYEDEMNLRRAVAEAVRLLVYDEKVINEQVAELCILKKSY